MASKPLNILVLNGPNLNLLGVREPDHYGSQTLDSIVSRLAQVSTGANVIVDHMQSNVESELIQRVHACLDDGTDGIILNPAAFTHTSVALRDALAAVRTPFIEVHLSNVYARESFRHHSYFSDLAIGVISGLGAYGYEAALNALLRELGQSTS
ncbi:MAG: type II 3-dehydroquinate dehydratase [Pseudomonadota bacterium]